MDASRPRIVVISESNPLARKAVQALEEAGFQVEIAAEPGADERGADMVLLELSEGLTSHMMLVDELRQIFDTAGHGMRLIGPDFKVLKANKTFRAMIGIDEPDAEGVSCYEQFSGSACRTPDCPLTQALEGADTIKLKVEKWGRSGRAIPCMLTATALRGPDGGLIGIVEDFKDISETRSYQVQLEKQFAELERIHSELELEEAELAAGALELRESNRRLEHSESQLLSRTAELGERIKELGLLYGVSRALHGYGDDPVRTLAEIADMLPAGFRAPDSVCARIVMDGESYVSEGFEESGRPLEAEITVADFPAGRIQVFSGDRTPGPEPFLDEERAMLESVAWRLGREIERERNRAELEALYRSREELDLIVSRSRTVAFLWKPEPGWPVTYVSGNVDQFGYSARDFISGALRFDAIIHSDDLDRVRKEVEEHSADPEVGDYVQYYRILAAHGRVRWVEDRTWVRRDAEGAVTHYQGLVLDITDRVRAEDQKNLSLRVLSALNESMDSRAAIRRTIEHIKDYFGVEAVAVRIEARGDYPYCRSEGFPGEFIETENSLCLRAENGEPLLDEDGNPVLECVCGRVIRGGADPEQPFFTEYGSFWTNSTSRLLAETAAEALAARPRGRCPTQGYESMALIPLRAGGGTIGLLQLCDSRPDMFDPELIEFLERLGRSVGVAVGMKLEHERTERTEREFRDFAETMPYPIFVLSPDGEFEYANPAFERAVGRRVAELGHLGRWFESAFPFEEYRRRVAQDWRRSATAPGGARIGEYNVTCGGEVRRMRFSVVVSDRGRRFVVAEDVTRRRLFEKELRSREEFKSSVIDSLADNIAIVNQGGEIIEVNEAWRSFARENHASEDFLGWNYLDVCDGARDEDAETAQAAARGIRAVLAGKREIFTCEYPCHSPEEQRWFSMRVTAVGGATPPRAVISHVTITGRVLAERDLQKSEERFRSVAELSPLPMAIIDERGRYSYINPRFVEVFGYAIDEIRARGDWFEKVYPDPEYRRRVKAAWKEDLAASRRYEVRPRTFSVTCRNGEVREILYRLVALDRGGHYLICEDITERRRFEDLIRAQSELSVLICAETDLESALGLVLDSAVEVTGMDCGGVFVYDRERRAMAAAAVKGVGAEFVEAAGRFDMNSRLLRQLGQRRPVHGDLRELGLVDPELVDREGIRAACFTGIEYGGEMVAFMVVGSHEKPGFPIEARTALDFIASRVGSALARIRAEEQLRENEQRFSLALEAASDGLWDWNPVTNEVFYGPRWYAMLDYEPGELPMTFETWVELLHPEDREAVEARLQAFLDKRYEQFEYEFRMRTRGGDWRWIRGRGKVVDRDADGSPLRIIGTHSDITERKRAEEEIKAKNYELESALTVKTEFLSMVSHELRSPLVPILGYAEIMLDGGMGPVPDELRNPIEVIWDRARALQLLIEDLLALSRIERNTLSVALESVPVKPFVGAVVERYRALDHGKPVRLQARTRALAVKADPRRLDQIMNNLVENAIKYSGDEVEIGILAEAREGMVAISVEDNGLGISSDQLEHIFEQFYQVEQVNTRSHPGAGLGLAIVKQLTEMMDGRVSVESALGRGSTFTVLLPRADEPPAPEPRRLAAAAETDAEPEPAVLIIDDDGSTNRLVKRMLRDRCRVLTAETGARGLELARSNKVDAILLDWMMPGTDGLSVLKTLKEDPATGGIPVLFLSGRVESESVREALDAGAERFMAKPFNRRDLLDGLAGFIGGGPGAT